MRSIALGFSIILLSFLFFPSFVAAEKSGFTIMEDKNRIHPDHQWSIFFNTTIDKDTITGETIYVTDSEEEKIPVSFKVVQNNVTVIPPKGGYEPGQKYKLTIGDNIKSNKGTVSQSVTQMSFTVTERSDFEDLSLTKEQLYINGKRIESPSVYQVNETIYVSIKTLSKQLGWIFKNQNGYVTIQLDKGARPLKLYNGRNVLYRGDYEVIRLKNGDQYMSDRIKELDGEMFIPINAIDDITELPINRVQANGMYHYVVGKSVPDKMLYKGEEFTNPMDVPLLNQMDEPRLYNGCEVTSLAMMLHYHGINVSKNKLAEEISRVPLTYSNGMKGNPNLGFVGDMENGPGLSAYHGPVVKLAKRYVGDRAQDVTGSNPSELYEYVNQGMPVWIITTTRFQPVSNFRTWLTPQGAIDVTFSVHSVVITGYTDDSVYINNPYGKKNQKVNRSQFEKAFKQMGSQAIVIQR